VHFLLAHVVHQVFSPAGSKEIEFENKVMRKYDRSATVAISDKVVAM